MTLIEVLAVVTIVGILAMAVFPFAKTSVKRAHEMELRRSLREIRTAIDRYKAMYDAGIFEKQIGASGYPPTLEILVTGVPLAGAPGKTVKLLRRIPRNPVDPGGGWLPRSHDDPSEASSWGGQDVFDVRAKSTGTALDGTRYADW